MDTSIETFHRTCLSNFPFCPMCYHRKNPDLLKNSVCMKCNTTDTLWFCITCGHVGCGHKIQRHAIQHYDETKHKYVMGLQEYEVWDYKIKKFLHIFEAKDTEKIISIHIKPSTESDCSCAICQYNSLKLKQPSCMMCPENHIRSMWICLSCNHVGCSRKKNSHALQHYTKTKHSYAMQLENSSIWDYNEQKYLHGQLHYMTSFNLPASTCNGQF